MCIDYALKALAIIPDDPKPHVQIAYAKARLKDSEAPEWARKAIALEPENAQWHAALADTYGILGKWREALTPMQDAVKLDPEKPGFQSGMGQCLTFLGKAKEAVPYLERALELNPQSAVSHARMSVAFSKRGTLRVRHNIFGRPWNSSRTIQICRLSSAGSTPEKGNENRGTRHFTKHFD